MRGQQIVLLADLIILSSLFFYSSAARIPHCDGESQPLSMVEQ